MNSFARRSRRAVAAILGLTLLGFDPALADDPGAAGDPTPSAPTPAAADDPTPAPTPSAPTPAAAAPIAAAPADPNPWAEGAAKVFDVVPIRLLSTAAVVVGFGAFVVSVPLVAPGYQMEGIRNSWEYFVTGPVDYTFVRPLGDF